MSDDMINNTQGDSMLPEDFARFCTRAWGRGWHEANGGNLSCRILRKEADALGASLAGTQDWHSLPAGFAELAGDLFLMTSSGSYLQNVEGDLEANAGIVEISDDGLSWRSCWGFRDAAPSSELMTHLAAYAEGAESDDGADRVVYHAHPPRVLALSATVPADTRIWTRVLWRSMTESIIMFPQGIAAVEWMVPGSTELARKTRELMSEFHVCVWAHHGVMVRAKSLDEAFGVVETLEKAADVYLTARGASGGNEPNHLVTDEQLQAICKRYGIEANESFLR